MIRTSDDWSGNAGRGYRPIVGLFAKLAPLAAPGRLVLHFTCLEMPDGDGGPAVESLAHSLVLWVGKEAELQQVPIKGENALSWNLPNADAWKNMSSVMQRAGNATGYYEGITILRMTDILGNDTAKSGFAALTGTGN